MIELFISVDGTVRAIFSEAIDFKTLGEVAIARASHVEPDENSQWMAKVIDGPELGPFERRSEALAAEVEWLTEHRLLNKT